MRQTREKLTRIGILAAATTASLLFAGPVMAQTVVQYTGSLMIGFGDSDNPTDLANNAVPICAVNGNPFAPATFGSLPVYGRANQTAAGALTFSAHGRGDGAGPQVESLKGGAEVRVAATCNVQVPPFLNPRLRSRIQAAAEIFPGIRGPVVGTVMGVYITPTPMIAPTWMVGPGQGNAHPGAVLNTPIPFFAGNGAVRITKGANNYGGAIQYQGGGGVQLGINTTIMTPGGATLMTFGVARYVNGFLPTDPSYFGTGAKGKIGPGATTMFPNGLILGNQRTMALRTAGGATINAQGKIVTLLGGNTQTPMGGPALRSPVNFQGAFFEWTTGMVQHTDMVGDFVTIRTATGFDKHPPFTIMDPAPYNTTRKLQLVSPWSASIKKAGPFGLPVPQLGFGGVAVLNLDITPAPEPGTVAMVGLGALGVAGLARLRRRSA